MNANNWPPVVQPGQPQPIPLTSDMIAVLSQRIIQMTLTFGSSKLRMETVRTFGTSS